MPEVDLEGERLQQRHQGTRLKAEIDGSTLRLTFAGTIDKFLSMSAAAAAILPERIVDVEGEVTVADGSLRSCAAPLSAFRDYGSLDADTIDGLLTYAQICALARIDGSSWLAPHGWSSVATRLTTLAEHLPITDRFRPVRQLRVPARDAGADQAAEMCTVWMRRLRTTLTA